MYNLTPAPGISNECSFTPFTKNTHTTSIYFSDFSKQLHHKKNIIEIDKYKLTVQEHAYRANQVN